MQQRLIELHQQRGRLLERIAVQRADLARQSAPLAGAVDLEQRVAALVQQARAFVVRHPVAIAAAAGSLLLLRPRTALRWGGRVLLVWRTWRSVRGVLPDWITRQFRPRP